MSKYEEDFTMYSEKVAGDNGNYKWAVRFDNTGPERYPHEPGYIGVTQFDENGKVKERVLLSPEQSMALHKFILKTRKL